MCLSMCLMCGMMQRWYVIPSTKGVRTVGESVRTESGISLEVFERGFPPPGSAVDPEVTVLARGTVSMNRAAAEALNFPEAVEFLFSAQDRVMGIRAAERASPRSFALSPHGKGSIYQTSGKSFIERYRIPHEKSTRYKATVEEGMLLVDLKQGGVDVSLPPRGERNNRKEG